MWTSQKTSHWLRDPEKVLTSWRFWCDSMGCLSCYVFFFSALNPIHNSHFVVVISVKGTGSAKTEL